MSIHNDPRRFSSDADECADWERDLRLEYRREEYEDKHPYDDCYSFSCDYQGKDGSCNCDDKCIHQTGKWRDVCEMWEESEDEEE